MKKFIIVVVFIFLIAILISFNYLLWDREKQLANYQDLSNAKNLSIDTLGEKINNLDKQNKELTERITYLEDENADLKRNSYKLQSENNEIKQRLEAKDKLIAMFKSYIDTETIENVIRKWAEAVNSKNYKAARTHISKTSTDEILNNEEKFKQTYQNELKTFIIKSSKLYTELIDDEHLAKIQFQVVFEVSKPETSEKQEVIFKSGENTKYITMEFDAEAGEWCISELSDKP